MSPSYYGLDVVKVRVPDAVLEIMQRLEGAGFETWCVGGAVRDALLHISHQDFDLATAATPDVVRRLFPRTVPIGVEHGTVGVLDDAGVLHEVTTFRKDVQTDGRHAVVEFGVSIEEDLARRDFTINAFAYHPIRKEWRDPSGGWQDLIHKVIRAVGDPAQRFHEDRLRILRAIRFARRFEFTIEQETWRAILAQGRDTADLSAERVRDEWVKTLATAKRMSGVPEMWLASGVASIWMPELHPFPDRLANVPSEDPVLPRDPGVLTALCANPSAPVWRRLKGSSAEIRRAEAFDTLPIRPVDNSPREVRRWMARVGDLAESFSDIAFFRGEDDDEWDVVLEIIRDRGEATSRAQLAVTGNDLIQEGVITPGPAMGWVLDKLLDAVLDDPTLNTRAALLELARRLA